MPSTDSSAPISPSTKTAAAAAAKIHSMVKAFPIICLVLVLSNLLLLYPDTLIPWLHHWLGYHVLTRVNVCLLQIMNKVRSVQVHLFNVLVNLKTSAFVRSFIHGHFLFRVIPSILYSLFIRLFSLLVCIFNLSESSVRRAVWSHNTGIIFFYNHIIPHRHKCMN